MKAYCIKPNASISAELLRKLEPMRFYKREEKKRGDIEEWEIVLQLSIFGKAIYLSDAITLTTKKQYQSNISSIRNWFPLLKSDLCWLTTVTVQLTNSLHTNAYMEALLKNEFEWQLKSTT